jgi:hypothetical protein
VRAFTYCEWLHEIFIPPSVKAIRNSAFFNFSQLTTVNGGDGLEEIGEGAFQYCTSLRWKRSPCRQGD